MIHLEHITIHYGKQVVIEDLHWDIAPGTHGLVGLNGSGKTTLINGIYGLKVPSGGTLHFNGRPLTQQDIAYLETTNFFYSRITGREYLALFKRTHPTFDIDGWNQLFDLPLDRYTEQYSTGMKKKLAFLGIIALIGSNQRRIILGAMLATAFLSMWISNTATSVMMLPIAMAIATQINDNPATAENERTVFGKALMLSIAYSASIGGMASLIGTPVNGVLVGQVKTVYGYEIGFVDWFRIGFPVAAVLLVICWYYLTRVAFRIGEGSIAGGQAEIARLRRAQGPITAEEVKVLVVFLLTALAWIFRKSVLAELVPGINDAVIAMLGAIALFLLPGRTAGQPLLTWAEAVRLPWGVVLLLGGGFALAAGFTAGGLGEYVGENLSVPDAVGGLIIVLAVVAGVNFFTEITSNVATTSMLLPVLAVAAGALNMTGSELMIPATLAATCAFMLPVATPPNAVVFGSGYLTIPDMARAGFRMNVISIIIISLFCYFGLPLISSFSF